MPIREKFKERIGSLPIAASEVVKLVDDIFDSLESQNCENCRFIDNCGWLDAIEKDIGVRPIGYGCQGWRSKDA